MTGETKATLLNTLTAAVGGVIESNYLPKYWHNFRECPYLYHFAALPVVYAIAVVPSLKKFNSFSPRVDGENRKKYFLKNGVKIFAHSSLWSSIYDMTSYIASYGLEKIEWLKQIYPEFEAFGKQLPGFPIVNVYNSIFTALFLTYISYTKRDSIKSAATKSFSVLSNLNKKILSRMVPEHCKENLKGSTIYQNLDKVESMLFI